MKKLILATCLMVNAVFASFAGVIINDLGPATHGGWFSFTFDSDGSYGIEFGIYTTQPFEIGSFGYYYLDNPHWDNWIYGTFTGDTSDYFSTVGSNSVGYTVADYNTTGYLGDFKAGDTIAIWIQFDGINTATSSDIGFVLSNPGGLAIYDEVLHVPLREVYFHLVDLTPASSGAPLPGVLAALAIGGCAFLGRKFRKSIKK